MNKQPADPSKRHVFISYKHDDFDFAENLKNRLQQVGFVTWIDNHIHAGEEWRGQIDQAIKSALAMVVIMTPEAKASEYVTYEWSFALGMGLKIIPIKYKQTPLHPRLEALQFLDFTSRIRPWDDLFAELETASQAALISANSESAASVIPSFIQQARIALNSTSVEMRHDAIATLAQADSAAAQDLLLEALSHPLADVRAQAALVLQEKTYPPALPRLIELLHDSTRHVRIAAISAVAASKDRNALPALLQILPQASYGEKRCIVDVLSTFGDVSILPTLLATYAQSNDPYLCMCINQALGALHSEQAIPALTSSLQNTAALICKSAAIALLRIATQDAINSLFAALLAMNSVQCEKIASSLPLGSPEEETFITFLATLYQNHLVIGISGAEREKAAQVRRRVIVIFRWSKSNKAIPILLQSMDDEDLVVQQETVLAFKAIPDERSLPALMTILRWRSDYYDEKTLLYAIQALAQIGNISILPQLKSVLHEMLNNPTELSIQLIWLFGKIGIYETAEDLKQLDAAIKRRPHPSHEITEAIAQSLKEIRSRYMDS